MKRVWFAIAFILICTASCFGEQIYINEFHKELNERIVQAEEEPNKESIKAVQEYYKKGSKILNAICDTERLDELNQAIKYLSIDDKEIGSALATARTINDSIFESQLVSASNIF